MSLSEKEAAEVRNLLRVQRVVRRSENPHPITIIGVIIVSILVIYCLYINAIKKSITGVWVDNEDKSYNINHNKWKDTIVINNRYPGIVKGNLVILYINNDMQMGVWMDKKIKWMNGNVWHCSFELHTY